MSTMLGKANPNQDAKLMVSLLSGNNLKGETLVCTSTAMLGCGEQDRQLNPERWMGLTAGHISLGSSHQDSSLLGTPEYGLSKR